VVYFLFNGHSARPLNSTLEIINLLTMPIKVQNIREAAAVIAVVAQRFNHYGVRRVCFVALARHLLAASRAFKFHPTIATRSHCCSAFNTLRSIINHFTYSHDF
jgi:hypothetical protein